MSCIRDSAIQRVASKAARFGLRTFPDSSDLQRLKYYFKVMRANNPGAGDFPVPLAKSRPGYCAEKASKVLPAIPAAPNR